MLLITIAAALVAVAGAGKASRILSVNARTAGSAGLIAGTGCVLANATLIGSVVVSGGAWSPLLIAVVTISAVRLSLATAAARRCAQLRAAG